MINKNLIMKKNSEINFDLLGNDKNINKIIY